MVDVQRTPQAKRDAVEIAKFISKESGSRKIAERFLDRLEERLQLLASQPLMGEHQAKLADGKYRRFVHGSHVIYYRPLDNGILVIRILHAARRHQDLL